jgi:Ca-activated chloride channel family protein
MSRTQLLLATTGLLALVALAVGLPPPPPFTDTSHTVANPHEAPAEVLLPLVTAHSGPLTLEGKLSGEYVKAGLSEVFAHVAVRASHPEDARRVPVNLALVLDRSGSMRGQKLADAKRAARELVMRLGPEDRLALVHYGTDVIAFPSTLMTEEARQQLLTSVDAIQDEGSTNISGALEAAAAELRPHVHSFRVSRIILVSDGQPTVGRVEPAEFAQLTRGYRDTGLTVSGLGVGEDFNEQLMQGIAEQGGGFYGFIDQPERLATILQRELEQAAATMARQVELRLELPPSVREAEVLGMKARREGRWLRVPLYDLAGGQQARVVVKLTLDASDEGSPVEVLNARVAYLDVHTEARAEAGILLTAKVAEDEALVRAHLDREVRVNAVRALGAQQMLAATEKMKEGDRQGALELLGKARQLFGSSTDFSQDVSALSGAESVINSGQDETELRRESLKLHRKSLSNFGQNNTY